MANSRHAAGLLALTLLAGWYAGCGPDSVAAPAAGQDAPAPPIPVFVSVEPQADLVERVAGPRASVEVLVQPGQNPHNFDATPQQVVRLSRARLYFSIGVEFEPAVLRRLAAEGGPQIVSMQTGVELLHGTCTHPEHTAGESAAAANDHNHDHAEHDHAGQPHAAVDPHIWLDPKRVRTIVATIRDTFVRVDPGQAAHYERNATTLLAEIDELDREIEALLRPFAGREFFVYHPAYAYFADSYGLKQVAIERDGKAPQGRELTEVIRRLAASGSRTIFYEPQFDRAAMEVVAREIGARAVLWDGLSRDWAGALRRAAQDLKTALEERS